MEYVLELKNIYKSFPGVKVLEDVTLQVRPGEVHALMGENGAGKSTLMKILMGIYKADQGSIFLEGKETVIHGPKDAMSKGISMIHQELNTVLDMEVAENVFVGRELLKKGFEKLKIVDIARMREETGKYFREMNIDIDPRAKMRTLSVAEMQLVEIVKDNLTEFQDHCYGRAYIRHHRERSNCTFCTDRKTEKTGCCHYLYFS